MAADAPIAVVYGSLNIDDVFRVDHIVREGETIATRAFEQGAGGKGANQSVAIARAGGRVRHLGRVGKDGAWLTAKMTSLGVETEHVVVDAVQPTGRAIIQVDAEGRNAIVLLAGCNHLITKADIDRDFSALGESKAVLVLQNETTCVPHMITAARARGWTVVFTPAPFTAAIADYPLDDVDVFLLNETEARALICRPDVLRSDLLDAVAARLPKATGIVVTLGGDGAEAVWKGTKYRVPAERVAHVVDSTGAGDTFAGYFVNGIFQRGLSPHDALERASHAAALSVQRKGAMDGVPSDGEVAAAMQSKKERM